MHLRSFATLCCCAFAFAQQPPQADTETIGRCADLLALPAWELHWGVHATGDGLILNASFGSEFHVQIPPPRVPSAEDLAALAAAIEADPEDFEARLALAEALGDLDRHGGVESEPGSGIALRRRMRANIAEAEQILRPGAGRDTEARLLAYARVLTLQGRLRESRALLQGLASADPPSWRAMVALARDHQVRSGDVWAAGLDRRTADLDATPAQAVERLLERASALADGDPGPDTLLRSIRHQRATMEAFALASMGSQHGVTLLRDLLAKRPAPKPARIAELTGEKVATELVLRLMGRAICNATRVEPGESDPARLLEILFAHPDPEDLDWCDVADAVALRIAADGRSQGREHVIRLASALLRGDAARFAPLLADACAASKELAQLVELLRYRGTNDLASIQDSARRKGSSSASHLVPLLLGIRALELGDTELAAQQLRLAQARAPESKDCRLALGIALARLDPIGEAAQAQGLLLPLTADPFPPECGATARAGLAWLAMRGGDEERAIGLATQAARQWPAPHLLRFRAEIGWLAASRCDEGDARGARLRWDSVRVLVAAATCPTPATFQLSSTVMLGKEREARDRTQAESWTDCAIVRLERLAAENPASIEVARLVVRLLTPLCGQMSPGRSEHQMQLLAALRRLREAGSLTGPERALSARVLMHLCRRDPSFLPEAEAAAADAVEAAGGEDVDVLLSQAFVLEQAGKLTAAAAAMELALAGARRTWGDEAINRTIDGIELELLRMLEPRWKAEPEVRARMFALRCQRAERRIADAWTLLVAARLGIELNEPDGLRRAAGFAARAAAMERDDPMAHLMHSLCSHLVGDAVVAHTELEAAASSLRADPARRSIPWLRGLQQAGVGTSWFDATRTVFTPDELRRLGL